MVVEKGSSVELTENEQKIIQTAYHIQAVLAKQKLNKIEARAAVKLAEEVLNQKE